MIDEHKDKRKYNNFGYHSTKCWLKGNHSLQPSTVFEHCWRLKPLGHHGRFYISVLLKQHTTKVLVFFQGQQDFLQCSGASKFLQQQQSKEGRRSQKSQATGNQINNTAGLQLPDLRLPEISIAKLLLVR